MMLIGVNHCHIEARGGLINLVLVREPDAMPDSYAWLGYILGYDQRGSRRYGAGVPAWQTLHVAPHYPINRRAALERTLQLLSHDCTYRYF
jgi:hypothetical protein